MRCALGKRHFSFPQLGIEPHFFGRPAVSLVAILTELSRLPWLCDVVPYMTHANGIAAAQSCVARGWRQRR